MPFLTIVGGDWERLGLRAAGAQEIVRLRRLAERFRAAARSLSP